jgi:hypothetical protein
VLRVSRRTVQPVPSSPHPRAAHSQRFSPVYGSVVVVAAGAAAVAFELEAVVVAVGVELTLEPFAELVCAGAGLAVLV